jgi:hypothetical protein
MNRLALTTTVVIACIVPAAAHPVHEVIQNAYLTLSPGSVDLELELTAGPQVASKVLAALDTNRDQQISHAEAAAYALHVLRASRILVDQRQARWRPLSIRVPSYQALLGAHGTIVLHARAIRPEHLGAGTLGYRNAYSPSESRCDANVFLKPAIGMRYRVTGQDRSQDGRELVVHYATERTS